MNVQHENKLEKSSLLMTVVRVIHKQAEENDKNKISTRCEKQVYLNNGKSDRTKSNIPQDVILHELQQPKMVGQKPVQVVDYYYRYILMMMMEWLGFVVVNSPIHQY